MILPLGTVVNNLGQDRLAGLKALDQNKTAKPLIALPLSESPNCAW